MPRVSVIMPAYNASHTIARAIESVLAQTEPAWELIIVDDGSEDATASVVSTFSDARIHLLRQDNQGASAARNHALDLAQGDYLCFIDSDDWYSPEYLQTLLSLMDSGTDLAVVTMTEHFGSDYSIPQCYGEEGRFDRIFGNESFMSLLPSGLICSSCDKLYRRSIIQDHHLRFPPGYFAEDTCFNLSYFRHVHTVAVCNAPLYNYDHTQSVVTTRVGLSNYQTYIDIHESLCALVPEALIGYVDEFVYHQYVGITIKAVRALTTSELSKIDTYMRHPLVRRAMQAHRCDGWREALVHRLILHGQYRLLKLIFYVA